MIDGLLTGLSAAISPFNLIMVFIGCFLGTFIGMLPGLGPMSIIAIMIPIAIQIGDPASALILLSRVYYGAIFVAPRHRSSSMRQVLQGRSPLHSTATQWHGQDRLEKH